MQLLKLPIESTSFTYSSGYDLNTLYPSSKIVAVSFSVSLNRTPRNLLSLLTCFGP